MGSVQERENLMSNCEAAPEVKVLYLVKIYDKAFQTVGLVTLIIE
jgi:hypothetical protein